MAHPTSVNSQVTDSVTQVNTEVVGGSPSVSLGNLFVATSQALSNAAHNATTSQQQSNSVSHAANTQGITTLYAVDTASTGIATHKIFA